MGITMEGVGARFNEQCLQVTSRKFDLTSTATTKVLVRACCCSLLLCFFSLFLCRKSSVAQVLSDGYESMMMAWRG